MEGKERKRFGITEVNRIEMHEGEREREEKRVSRNTSIYRRKSGLLLNKLLTIFTNVQFFFCRFVCWDATRTNNTTK